MKRRGVRLDILSRDPQVPRYATIGGRKGIHTDSKKLLQPFLEVHYYKDKVQPGISQEKIN